MEFFTIKIDDKCYDLPKNMNIPCKGDTVFINDTSGIVDKINYHIADKKLFMVSIDTVDESE